jgi:hypothetical protein
MDDYCYVELLIMDRSCVLLDFVGLSCAGSMENKSIILIRFFAAICKFRNHQFFRRSDERCVEDFVTDEI